MFSWHGKLDLFSTCLSINNILNFYRSKIQGLGLYAARDLEKHTMVIEYIGEIIRTEVSEWREKQYEAKVNKNLLQ